MPATPSQTIGPFYGYALPFARGGDMASDAHPEAVTVHGYVLDGEGAPIPDALLEFWQPAPDGSLTGAPGSLRTDPTTGVLLGRDHTGFTGFGRVPTDADGHYALRTLTPPAVGKSAPYLSVCLFARGLLHHLYTRVYFPEHEAAQAADPLLAALPPRRRATLVARGQGPRSYRFDVRIQGGDGDGADAETVFLAFPLG
ncbi:protocatechuate 3,4-dioxygenase subunit alpha [Actinocrinis puniceicyclus]|uniref:Protocatechuate 3,4-dioxygenase subunit alpha n=1 Tax=Actinocrinis puniceicyclus TaxID=977794 RepID=A0A8J7WJ21_9ACTN|nr:protocatechuate 3,4-dioxygenase subunit alpha [Actinocrinis puniceicyclus]